MNLAAKSTKMVLKTVCFDLFCCDNRIYNSLKPKFEKKKQKTRKMKKKWRPVITEILKVMDNNLIAQTVFDTQNKVEVVLNSMQKFGVIGNIETLIDKSV